MQAVCFRGEEAMRNKLLTAIFLGGVAILSGCGTHTSSSAPAETATVHLKDGTTFEGAVTKSDASSITVRASGGETRSYPMSQVDSVKYAALPPTKPNIPFSPGAPVVSGSSPDGRAAQTPVIPEPMHTIRSGTRATVLTTGAILADTAGVGQRFHAVIVGNVVGEDGKVAIPNGSEAMLEVRAVNAQGRSELTLDLDSITVDGRPYQLKTNDIVDESKRAPGGALRGTIVSVAPQESVRGNSINIPAGSTLTFLLEARIEIQPE